MDSDTELEYVYRKGKGWVIRSVEEPTIIRRFPDRNQVVTIYDRRPEVGEWGWSVEHLASLGDVLDFHHVMVDIAGFSRISYGWLRSIDKILHDDVRYVTVVTGAL